MPHDGLKELVEAASDHFHNSADQDVRVPAFILARTRGNQIVHMPLPYKDAETKAKMLHMAMLAFGFWEVIEYVVAFESWVVKREYPVDALDIEKLTAEICPSQEPDRQDGIIFTGASHHSTICGYADVVSYGGGIAIGETKWFDGSEGLVDGHMFRLLPPPTLPRPPENLKKAFFEQFPALDLSRRVWDTRGNKEGA